ncbi:MAG TPA: NAD(P)/FAD-dependent oxidoreductase [Patescibacteria group bacterium]|nr:NAD(P)/FAD-dependent oxidoreductase [Patescibacteria group bacterium]
MPELRDVAIIGGGPGGSTAGNLLAQAGRRVVLFERERFPRFHIGESLLPHNMRLFDRLGLTPGLKMSFMEKWGIEFVSSGGDLRRLFHFDEGVEPRYPMCFQVRRSEFDQRLLEEAARRGCEVRQESTVKVVEPEPDGTWRLSVAEPDGGVRDHRARFLIDASGRDGVYARTRGLRAMDPRHRRAAVFAHYRGVPRRAGRDAGNIIVVMLRDGWFWFIPFSDGQTSVGVVAEGRRLGEQGLAPEAALDLAIARCPAARALMASAERVSPVTATSDWTYNSRRIAGPSHLLVGDAAAFIDPVFSTGVLLAMSSAEMAADLAGAALDRGAIPAAAQRRYERSVVRHVAGYRRMVDTFYTEAFPRLCFFPEKRIGIAGAVISFLAGDMEPSWRIRWRLELFYRVADLYRLFDAGPRVALTGVFEQGLDAPGGAHDVTA